MRLVDDEKERPKVRTTVMAEIVRGLQLGVEYGPRTRRAVPLLSWRAVSEGHRRPSVVLGSSGDRQGVPHGQAYYVTVAKALNHSAPVVAPYVGASYGVENELRAIGGLNLIFSRNWSAILIHDGVQFHPTVTFSWRGHDFTAMYVNLEDVGLAWSYRF